MRVNIKRAKCMDKENIYGTRENTMKVNGLKDLKKATEFGKA